VAGREVQGRTGVGYGESEIELSEYVVCMWERLGEPESQKYPIPPSMYGINSFVFVYS